MPRPAGDQPPIPHPLYPDHIRLYVDRKRRGNGVVEAQFKLSERWSGYRLVRRAMPDAMRLPMELWVRMQHGGDLTPLPAGRPGSATPKPDKQATDIFAAAAFAVIQDIRAEQGKAETLYGRHSGKLDKFSKNVTQINSCLVPYFRAMRCKDISDAIPNEGGWQAGYRSVDVKESLSGDMH